MHPVDPTIFLGDFLHPFATKLPAVRCYDTQVGHDFAKDVFQDYSWLVLGVTAWRLMCRALILIHAYLQNEIELKWCCCPFSRRPSRDSVTTGWICQTAFAASREALQMTLWSALTRPTSIHEMAVQIPSQCTWRGRDHSQTLGT